MIEAPTTTDATPEVRQLTPVIRHIGAALTTDLATRAAVLVTSLIVARAVEPVTFSVYLAWLSVALLAAVVWDAGVSTLAQRQIAMSPHDAGAVIRQGLRLRLYTLPAWGLAFTVGLAIVARLSDIDVWTAALFMGASLVAGLRSLATSALQGRMRFARAGVALAVGRWSTACASLAVLIPGQEAHQLLVAGAALFAGDVIALAVTLGLNGRLDHLRSSAPNALTLRNALPLAANAVMAQTYNRMDVLIVASLTSATQVGIYAPASRLQDAMYVLPAAVGVVALSVFSRQFGETRSRERIQRSVPAFIAIGLAVSIPVALALTLFMPAIVELVLGKPYLESVQAARVLVWSVIAASLVAPLLAALIAIGRAGDTTKVFGATLVTALVLHASLDWWAGAIGAAAASLGRDAGAVVAALVVASRAGILPRTATGWAVSFRAYRRSERASK